MLLIKSCLKFWNYRLAIITFHRVNLSIRRTAQGHVPSPDSFSSLIKIESNYNTISVLNIILYFEYKMKRTMKKTHSNFMHHTFFKCLVFYTLYLNGDTNHNFRKQGQIFVLLWVLLLVTHLDVLFCLGRRHLRSIFVNLTFHFISFHFILLLLLTRMFLKLRVIKKKAVTAEGNWMESCCNRNNLE